MRLRALTELLQKVRFRWRHRGGRPIVLVHQMARVGSITVLRALRRGAPGLDIYHTHYLNADTIARFQAQFDHMYRVTGVAGLHREFLAARYLRRRIDRGVRNRWRIITLVRDPVARTVSAFLKHFPYTYPERGLRFLEDPANVPALIDMFLAETEPERRFTLDWFEREMESVFGIDVYSTPFPHEDGHATYSGPFADALLLRLEDLGRVGARSVAQFLNTPPLTLDVQNRSTDSSYSETHRRFLSDLRLPEWYLDRMYDSRLARHFYRTEELASMRATWTRGNGEQTDHESRR
jgi:hypothetical protein